MQYNKDSNKLEVISGLLRSCMILLFYKDLTRKSMKSIDKLNKLIYNILVIMTDRRMLWNHLLIC